jgi:hypothetical protein
VLAGKAQHPEAPQRPQDGGESRAVDLVVEVDADDCRAQRFAGRAINAALP